MAILDRFRTQPRQKHADPAVRLALVQEIPFADRGLLAEFARDDPDGRVRQAAVAKLMDPATLAVVARNDSDEGVRNAALAMLRDIALDAFEGLAEADSLAAVDALADGRMLATVAKTATHEPVAARALSRITDVHAIGSIARHAPIESIRRAALGALHDHAEIFAVAMKGEFKDTAMAAVERLAERDDLEQIAERAKSKNAVKRARALIREIDERAAAVAAAAAPRLVVPEPIEMQTPTIPEAAGIDHARLAAESAETAERERLDAEAAARQLDVERDAERRRREEEEERQAERRRGRLIELAQEAEAAAADPDLTAARRRLGIVAPEWTDLGAGATIDPEVAARHAAALAHFDVREQESQEQDRRARREALARAHQLLSRIEPLVARADLSLKVGDRALRDIRTALGDVPPLPSKQDHDDVVQRLKAAQAALTPRMQELRDIAEWQRWANVGIQEQLCDKMEALSAVEDPEEIARQVRELQQQWQLVVDVPRAQSEALWRRFKTAHDRVWPRCEAYFAAQAQVRAENLAKKIALSERAEALADSSNWIQTADEIKRLQAEWKTIGPVTRGQEKVIWERFRAACDRFFKRRHADLADRKKLWAENLAKKEALCAKVEGLVDSVEWDAAAAELRRLQVEWKSIGPVKKSRSEAIWQRFHGACDRFFTRFARRHDMARAEKVAACETLCAELESLAAPPDATVAELNPPADLPAKVRLLRTQWQQLLASRGVDRERAVALDGRFQAGFAQVLAQWPAAFAGTDLDLNANRKRMETLVRRVEELARSVTGGTPDADLSPTTRLAAMLKEALAANTIGGKVEEESRLRAAAEEVRQAQSSWSRLGPVPDDVRRELSDRFSRASRAIIEKAGAAGKPAPSGMAGTGPRAGGPRR